MTSPIFPGLALNVPAHKISGAKVAQNFSWQGPINDPTPQGRQAQSILSEADSVRIDFQSKIQSYIAADQKKKGEKAGSDYVLETDLDPAAGAIFYKTEGSEGRELRFTFDREKGQMKSMNFSKAAFHGCFQLENRDFVSVMKVGPENKEDTTVARFIPGSSGRELQVEMTTPTPLETPLQPFGGSDNFDFEFKPGAVAPIWENPDARARAESILAATPRLEQLALFDNQAQGNALELHGYRWLVECADQNPEEKNVSLVIPTQSAPNLKGGQTSLQIAVKGIDTGPYALNYGGEVVASSTEKNFSASVRISSTHIDREFEWALADSTLQHLKISKNKLNDKVHISLSKSPL